MYQSATKELAKYIDHTLLRPTMTVDDADRIIEEAIDYGFYAVCLPPYFLPHARKKLSGSTVKLATVAGFPLGYNLTSNKTEMVLRCADAGAQEVDFVMNIAAVKSRDWEFVEEELYSVSTAAGVRGIVIKAILETCYLEKEEIIKICNLCLQNGVHFVKTSTGFGSGGATLEHVRLMKSIVGEKVKIKASGGIKTRKQALDFIKVGADRIGTSSGISIINELI